MVAYYSTEFLVERLTSLDPLLPRIGAYSNTQALRRPRPDGAFQCLLSRHWGYYKDNNNQG